MVCDFDDGRKQLLGVNRLDEVIGNFGSYSLLHQHFLFAFGHHNHRQEGILVFEPRKHLQSTQTGHVLIQQDDVIVAQSGLSNRFGPVIDRCNFVALTFQK